MLPSASKAMALAWSEGSAPCSTGILRILPVSAPTREKRSGTGGTPVLPGGDAPFGTGETPVLLSSGAFSVAGASCPCPMGGTPMPQPDAFGTGGTPVLRVLRGGALCSTGILPVSAPTGRTRVPLPAAMAMI